MMMMVIRCDVIGDYQQIIKTAMEELWLAMEVVIIMLVVTDHHHVIFSPIELFSYHRLGCLQVPVLNVMMMVMT